MTLINPGPVETSRQADSHRVGAPNHHRAHEPPNYLTITIPKGHSRMSTPPKCPNGHAVNSNGNCFVDGCVYSNANRHE